jgi:K+-transporting ATPase ATPase C chain
MRQNLKIAILFTIVTTVLLGIIYPLIVTGLSQVLFHDKANGQLTAVRLKVEENQLVGVFGGIGVCVDGLKGA